MKLTHLETIRIGAFPNLLWLRLHAENGLAGLGETFIGPAAVEAYLHETAAPLLAGSDGRAIRAISRRLNDLYVGFDGSGTERRANSAIDIALWDLLGKELDQPVTTLLGGPSRSSIATYNTCAGPDYVRGKYAITGPDSWSQTSGHHQDLEAFLHRPGQLAEELLADGIAGMKIWPFDRAAVETGGTHISADALKDGVAKFADIRRAVGDRMAIMAEMHALWLPGVALQIAEALRPYDIFWIEDPIKMRSMPVLRDFTERSPLPVCASETLGGFEVFVEMIGRRAVDVVMIDLGFVGGLTVGRQISDAAEAAQLPITLHDCTGPVVYAASVQMSLHAPTAIYQESVRAFYDGWYRELIDGLPTVTNGTVAPSGAPGLGIALRDDVFERNDITVRITELA